MSAATPLIVQQAEAEQLLARIDVLQAMRQLFLDLAAGQALQPAQQLVEFPAGRGDFINYLGVLAQEQVYGVKTSPYIVREQGPLVTAWTLLMSMQTGQPLLLCDAARLTTARTAATTARGGGCPGSGRSRPPGADRQRTGSPCPPAIREGPA